LAYAEIDPDPRRDDRRKVMIATRYDEKPLIQQVPGSVWDSKNRTWRAPLSWSTCVSLRGVFAQGLKIGPRLWAWAAAERGRVDWSSYLRELVELPEGWPSIDDRLYPFQQVGVMWLNVAGNALLGDEMGGGKTVQQLTALRVAGDGLPALVICPNSVKDHWRRHIAVWNPLATPYVVGKGAVNRRRALTAASQDPTAFVIINIEAVRLHSKLAPYGSIHLARCVECDPEFGNPELRTARCETHEKELNGFGFKTVVMDEAHRILDPQAKQTRAVWAVMHDESVTRHILMTGTPLRSAVDDMWSLLHAMAPIEFPVKGTFVDRYCMLGWGSRGTMEVIGLRPDTREEFWRVVGPYYRRMPKALVLPQLPPRVREIRYVEMGREQARMYKELEETLVTFNDDGEPLIAASNLVAATRLLQLSSSSVSIEIGDRDDPKTWRVTLREPSPKIDDLEELLDGELGDTQFVVAAEHRQLIELAHARLDKRGVRCAMITGAIPELERDRAIANLHAGNIQAILFTMKAGGVGIDLSPARVGINLQRSWEMVANVQSEARYHRIGSERHESITTVDIVTQDTIEEKQIARLLVKLKRLEEINRDKARLAAAGVDITQLEEEEARLNRAFLGEPNGDLREHDVFTGGSK
jgi:SNF2 family DNA or RNA helicase